MATRKYHSSRRVNAAAATRDAILGSAHALFLARGYAGVTVGEIAEAANVAVPTVYTSVGNKAGILTALLEPALTDPAITDSIAAVEASNDPGAVIDLTAGGTRLTHERHWDLVYGLFYRNPPGEPAAQAVLDQGANNYAQALGRVAARLVALDALRPGTDHAECADLLWFYLGPHAWMTLVGERAWTFDRAQSWMADSARHALLSDCRGARTA
ncbi:TetR/AcrR family transcriptional regulator [Streptomyces sp. NPDC001414]